jgi:hypothetical protein
MANGLRDLPVLPRGGAGGALQQGTTIPGVTGDLDLSSDVGLRTFADFIRSPIGQEIKTDLQEDTARKEREMRTNKFFKDLGEMRATALGQEPEAAVSMVNDFLLKGVADNIIPAEVARTEAIESGKRIAAARQEAIGREQATVKAAQQAAENRRAEARLRLAEQAEERQRLTAGITTPGAPAAPEAPAAPSLAGAPEGAPTPAEGRQLTRDEALVFLRQAGGDKNLARELAIQEGFIL